MSKWCVICGHGPLSDRNRTGMCDPCGKRRSCYACGLRRVDVVAHRCPDCPARPVVRRCDKCRGPLGNSNSSGLCGPCGSGHHCSVCGDRGLEISKSLCRDCAKAFADIAAAHTAGGDTRPLLLAVRTLYAVARRVKRYTALVAAKLPTGGGPLFGR